MNFVLKQFDDVLLNFSAKRTMDGMDISITAINKDKTERLPLGMEPTSESPHAGCDIGRFRQTVRMHKISYQRTV